MRGSHIAVHIGGCYGIGVIKAIVKWYCHRQLLRPAEHISEYRPGGNAAVVGYGLQAPVPPIPYVDDYIHRVIIYRLYYQPYIFIDIF